MAVSFAQGEVDDDSDYVFVGGIGLSGPGRYSLDHPVAYPTGGVYRFDSYTSAGAFLGSTCWPHDSGPQGSGGGMGQDPSIVHANNVDDIRLQYWRWVAEGLEQVPSVRSEGAVACEMLVVAFEEFVEEIAPLCDYWEYREGVDVSLVTVGPTDLDPGLVKDSILRHDLAGPLRYVWLVGSAGKSDPVLGQVSLVPTSEELLDYFFADMGDGGHLEFAVGRLPARDWRDVVFYVDKELEYHGDTSWGGRKDPQYYDSALVVCSPDDGDFPNPADWNVSQVNAVVAADNVESVLNNVLSPERVHRINSTSLSGYGGGVGTLMGPFADAVGAEVYAGRHVVVGVSDHNSYYLWYSLLSRNRWAPASTTPSGNNTYWRPVETFWLNVSCLAASPYCNPRLTSYDSGDPYYVSNMMTTFELFESRGLAVFGSMKRSWNSVVSDVAPAMVSRLYSVDPVRSRPLSIGDAWVETFAELYDGASIFPRGLECYGLLGNPALYVRECYDSTAAVGSNDTGGEFAVRVLPNPFNGTVIFAIDGAVDAKLFIDIYDVRGRRVYGDAFVLDGGHVNYAWSAVDERGTSVASGSYFVRLRSAEVELVQRVVYLK